MIFSGLKLIGDTDSLISIASDERGFISDITYTYHKDGEPFEGYITPGLIDTHIHGAGGFDTSDGDVKGILEMSRILALHGIAAFCPTTMTISAEDILKSCRAVSEAQKIIECSEEPYSKILGIRLEGPLFNKDMCGVQKSDCCLTPDEGIDLIERIESEFPDLIKIIDISPELDGADRFISLFKDRYVISLAHTNAGYDIASNAFSRGAVSITHALNAMPPILKRETGVLGAAIDNNAYVEVIADLHHIHGAMLKLLYSDVFEGKVITISDSMRGAFMPDGIYDLGGTPVTVKDNRTYFGPEGNIAGSVSCLTSELSNLMSLGIDPGRIVDSMTVTPLGRMGLLDDKSYPGIIETGRPCTFNVYDKEYNLIRTIINGKSIK